jgi:predicted HTH transcriptional regulator
MLNSAHIKNAGSPLSLPEDLISFGLMKNDDILTRAGALFADYCPVYNSRVFCTRWSGLSMGAGIIDALDDAEFSGNILTLVKNGIDFMLKHNRVMWNKPGLIRIEMPDYPTEALTEALTNAIIHRSYILPGTEVHIDIYDNRIEITSPGGMYDSKPIQELDLNSVVSKRRNPILADVFQRIDYAERRGTGLKKILGGYEGKERQPKFYSDDTTFRTTLYNLNYGTELEKYANGIVNGRNGACVDNNVSDNVHDNGTVSGTTNGIVNGTVNGTDGTANENSILMALKDAPRATYDELVKKLGISRRTIARTIKSLNERGIVKRIGSDKTGYWRVIDKDGDSRE